MSAWIKKLHDELEQNDIQRRKEAEDALGNYTYWGGFFWCLCMLDNGKKCRKQYKYEKALQNHCAKKHAGCNLPGKPDPNKIVEDQDDIESIEEVPDDVEDEIEEIEEISTRFVVKNGIFQFVDE